MESVVILSAVRTPIGKYKGALKNISAVDLAALVIKEAISRADVRNDVAQVFMGNVIQAGNGQNVARQASVKAGLPYQVPATTINEVCGSGLKSIIFGMQQIQLGQAEVVVAGGTENMSQAPQLTHFDFAAEEWQAPISSMIYDGLTDAFSGQHMGLTAEKIADKFKITRQMQDAFALESQKKAAAAATDQKFSSEIVPVPLADGSFFKADESIRFDTSLEKIAKLKPAFKENGSVTAANASTLNDGASALVLASKSYATAHNLPYLAEIEGYSEVGIDPSVMGLAPITAIQELLAKQNIKKEEVDLFQINEAFSAASLAVNQELELPSEKVNIYGGAVALGHPIGATGARIVTTLLSELSQENQERGVASLCIGGGLGLALMVKKNSVSKNPEKKFYQLSQSERIASIAAEKNLNTAETKELFQTNLPEKIATNLIENQISEVAIPLGVAQNFIINGEAKVIPMATEEPSVIAAASNAAKIIGQAGGITTEVLSHEMIGQIVLQRVEKPEIVIDYIENHQTKLFEIAAAAYPSIVKRGGGLRKINYRTLPENFFSIDLVVDAKDAMGANIVNTILEGVTKALKQALPEIDILFSILSNYGTESLVAARCQLPFSVISQKTAEKIAAASRYAQLDIYRATTHNKGIMNGIDAVVLATGNDNRAVAAACHAYAARSGQYKGLATWKIKGESLVGELIIPMKVGTVGGATKVLPKAQVSLKILDIQTASQLSEIITAVGLAQNLAAVRALVTTGIQKGHMGLQSRSLAITAGATEIEIPLVTEKLKASPRMDLATAEAIIKELRK